MHSLSGKVIVLTGAASGMGLVTAKYLSEQGATVSIADVNKDALNQVASDIEKAGGKVLATVVDVRNRSQVEDWIKRTVETFGRLDGCVNAAGVASKQHATAGIEEVDDDDFDFVQAVNVKGVLNCLRAQIPHLTKGGSIVNFASIAGLIGLDKNAAYTASKFAVVALTKCAAKELAERQIRCNCVCPGAIATPLLQYAADHLDVEMESFKDTIPFRRLGQPIEVAHLVAWLLSDGSLYITGTSQRIDGGWIDSQ